MDLRDPVWESKIDLFGMKIPGAAPQNLNSRPVYFELGFQDIVYVPYRRLCVWVMDSNMSFGQRSAGDMRALTC